MLEDKLREAKQVGKMPHIVTAVHFAGSPCEYGPNSYVIKKVWVQGHRGCF